MKKTLDIFAFKGVIFDLDGTLLNSNGVWKQVDVDFLKRVNRPFSEDYTKAVSSMHFNEAAKYTIERYGLEMTADEVIHIWNEMAADKYAHEIELFEGAAELVERLHSRQIKIGLATASSRRLFEPALRRNGIYDFFSAFSTVDEVKRGKAFADIYELTAQKMGLAPDECVVFEDIELAVGGAKSGGFACAAKLNEAENGESTPEFLQADMVFKSFFEF